MSLGRYTDAGIEIDRPLGETRLWAVGEDRTTAVLGAFENFVALGGAGGAAAFLIDLIVDINPETGDFTGTGITEASELMRYLAALLAAGRLEAAGDEAVIAAGISLQVFGANPEEPLVLEHTAVPGRFYVRGLDHEPIGRPLIEVVRDNPMAPGEIVRVELRSGDSR